MHICIVVIYGVSISNRHVTFEKKMCVFETVPRNQRAVTSSVAFTHPALRVADTVSVMVVKNTITTIQQQQQEQ